MEIVNEHKGYWAEDFPHFPIPLPPVIGLLIEAVFRLKMANVPSMNILCCVI